MTEPSTETVSSARLEKILLLEKPSKDGASETAEIICGSFPTAMIQTAWDRAEYERAISSADFDLVVIGDSLCNGDAIDIIRTLKLRDHEPAVLVVSNTSSPNLVSEAYTSGAHRFIVQSGNWKEELGPAARHLLRIRKLEAENRQLLAKLTEANSLLEEKNKRLDEFSATIAHDIRGPLGGISMKLDYIMEENEGKLDEKFVMLLKRALDSTDRLTHVVQAMYDFARLGAKAAKMGEVPLAPLIEGVVKDLNVDESRDVAIGMGELPIVWGNSELLQRVFLNLVSNAIKYNDKDKVEINIGVRGYKDRSVAKFVEIFIADNGPGIPQDEVRDLFTMFSRGSSGKKGSDGVGIGLAVVQRIVELHFGTIRVETDPGKGATFVLTLPIERTGFIGR